MHTVFISRKRSIVFFVFLNLKVEYNQWIRVSCELIIILPLKLKSKYYKMEEL